MLVIKKTPDQQLEELRKKPEVKYYLDLMSKTPSERKTIIDDYDSYLLVSKNSEAGKIYSRSKAALFSGDKIDLRKLGGIAREKLINHYYEKPPQSFDPKYVGNKGVVMQYRQLYATITKDIPEDIKETLL